MWNSSPQFPGGIEALYKFLNDHIRYPEQAAQNNIQGRVTVQFVVERDGSIGEVKVVRGKDPDLDKEAVRVVKSLPNFIPGKNNGQAVRVVHSSHQLPSGRLILKYRSLTRYYLKQSAVLDHTEGRRFVFINRMRLRNNK